MKTKYLISINAIPRDHCLRVYCYLWGSNRTKIIETNIEINKLNMIFKELLRQDNIYNLAIFEQITRPQFLYDSYLQNQE